MHNESNCSICQCKNVSKEGLEAAEKEVLPFLKTIMKLRPNHPFPMRFGNLFRIVYAYSQALTYDRLHNFSNSIFYTENEHLLKYSRELKDKFGMSVLHPSTLPKNVEVGEACEFNAKVLS